MKVLLAIATGGILCLSPQSALADTEERLAQDLAAENSWKRMAAKKMEDAERQRWVAMLAPLYPSYPKFLSTHFSGLKDHAEQGRWKEYGDLLRRGLEATKDHPGFQNGVMASALTHIKAPKTPDGARRDIVEAVLPFLRGRTSMVLGMRKVILDGIQDPVECYLEAEKLEEAVGTMPGMRGFLAGYLIRALPAFPNPSRARAAAERFLARYGENNPEGRSVRKWILRQSAESEDARAALEAMTEEERTAAEKDKNFGSALAACLNAGDVAGLPGLIRDSLEALPPFAREGARMRTVAALAKHPLPARKAAAEAILDGLQKGEISESATKIFDFLRKESPRDPDVAPLLMRALQHIAWDLSRETFWRLDSAVKILSTTPASRIAALAAAGDCAWRVHARDLAADYSYEAGRMGWSLDADRARSQLAQAVEWAPDSSPGIRAAWLLEALSKKDPVSQTLAPRPYDPRFQIPDAAPSMNLPKPGKSPDFFENDGETVRLRRLEPAAISASRSVASSGELRIAEGRLKEPWIPREIPATLLLGLESETSLTGLTLKLVGSLHLTVSLLNGGGRVLARFERDWGFWENLFMSLPWAQGIWNLRFPVVDHVAFARIEVFNLGITDSGIREISLQSPPYPGWALREGKARPIPSEAKSFAISATRSEPTLARSLLPGREDFRAFNIFRWRSPWQPKPGPTRVNPAASAWFHGDSAQMVLSGTGLLDWDLDRNPSETTPRDHKEPSALPIGRDLAPGLHSLRLRARPIPAAKDSGGTSDLMVHELRIQGRSRVTPIARFSPDGKTWSPWMVPPPDAGMNIPAKGAKFVQDGLLFDTRGVDGAATAEARDLALNFSNEPGAAGAPLPVETPRGPIEDLSAASEFLKERDAVVVYAKSGDPANYETARQIANRAGLYLVSDDVGLNNFPGRKLVVGTPLRNRYTRQLVVSQGLWLSPDFLNNPEGVIFQNSADGNVYVMGETSEAVARAGQRLLAGLTPHQPDKEPFRLFEASVLETIFPWQLHPRRTQPQELALRLGRSDRRSTQVGLTTNRELKDLRFSCSPLVNEKGHALPETDVLTRIMNGYEWLPFFGQLRIPNLLSPTPVLPMPPHAATGIWLTVRTRPETPAGDYRGEITVSSDAFSATLPVHARVEEIPLPATPPIPMTSFARTPGDWFVAGSDLWKKAARSLAADDARHGTNVVLDEILSNQITWEALPASHPKAVAAAGPDTTPPQWRALPLALKPGETCLLQIEGEFPADPLGVGVEAQEPVAWKLEKQEKNASWTPVATSKKPAGARGIAWFEIPHPLEPGLYRLTPEKSVRATLTGIAGFRDKRPLRVEFPILEEWMRIVDAAYAAEGVPPPGFLVEEKISQAALSRELLGVDTRDDLSFFLARELRNFLDARGLTDRFIIKIGDEPPNFADWTDRARPFREAGLQVTTAHSANHDNLDKAIGIMNPWMPNYQQNIFKPFFRERQKAGDKVWWYICEVPNVRINGPLTNGLPFYWLTAKWHFDGALNYTALLANDYSMPVPFRYEHGLDHRVALLPDATLLDSNRREIENDGIRDYTLINFIRRKGNQETQQQLENLIESMVPNRYGYTNDPTAWTSARNRLYDLATQAAKP